MEKIFKEKKTFEQPGKDKLSFSSFSPSFWTSPLLQVWGRPQGDTEKQMGVQNKKKDVGLSIGRPGLGLWLGHSHSVRIG